MTRDDWTRSVEHDCLIKNEIENKDTRRCSLGHVTDEEPVLVVADDARQLRSRVAAGDFGVVKTQKLRVVEQVKAPFES